MTTAGLYPERQSRIIDYERMNREGRKLKSSLTRAVNTGDPLKIADAVDKALDVWCEVGAWPDDWNRWRIALEDAWSKFQRDSWEIREERPAYGQKVTNRLREVAARIDV